MKSHLQKHTYAHRRKTNESCYQPISSRPCSLGSQKSAPAHTTFNHSGCTNEDCLSSFVLSDTGSLGREARSGNGSPFSPRRTLTTPTATVVLGATKIAHTNLEAGFGTSAMVLFVSTSSRNSSFSSESPTNLSQHRIFPSFRKASSGA